jgi:hypothetical protein
MAAAVVQTSASGGALSLPHHTRPGIGTGTCHTGIFRWLLVLLAVESRRRRGDSMLLAPLVGAALVISVATGPITEPTGLPAMSPQQKNAAVQALVRSATECIARTVTASPSFGQRDLGDLIVDSMSVCLTQVRAMIDGYDNYFGAGTGEAFFMGPYLDVLPTAVSRWGKAPAN